MNLKTKILIIVASSLVGAGAIATGTTLGIKHANNKEAPKVGIDLINEYLEMDYKFADVKVTSTKGELKLNSNYKVKNFATTYLIDYQIERFALIDLENGIIPSSPIETKKGQESKDGNFNLTNFIIDPMRFKTSTYDESTFKGTIRNAKYYLHTDYDVSNFEITIEYSSRIDTINYSYVDNKNVLNEVTINTYL